MNKRIIYLCLILAVGIIGAVLFLRNSFEMASLEEQYTEAGDDGVVHFTHTLQEHEAATDKYCTDLCRAH